MESLTFQSIQEEIAKNLIAEIQNISENGTKEQFDAFFEALSEEQVKILQSVLAEAEKIFDPEGIEDENVITDINNTPGLSNLGVKFMAGKRLGGDATHVEHDGKQIALATEKPDISNFNIRAGQRKDPNINRIQKLVGAKDDGIFGNETKQKVMDFQRKHNLKVDGIVGNETMSKIGRAHV